MSDKKPYDVSVSSRSRFMPEDSDEKTGRYVYRYTMTITNNGTMSVQLMARHWVINDETREIQNFRGLGVLGNQPVIRPGESYEYTSGTIFATPTGRMRGSYELHAEDGKVFEAPIPEFRLGPPRVLH